MFMWREAQKPEITFDMLSKAQKQKKITWE